MLILIIIIVILAIITYYYTKRTFSYWKERNIEQHDILSILKAMCKVCFGKEHFLVYWQKVYHNSKHLRYLGVYQFGAPMLMIRDEELVKAITVKDFDHFTDHKEMVSSDVDPFSARNLFSLKSAKWRVMRATLSPAFTGSKMRGMFTLIDAAAKKYVDFYKSGPSQFSLECKDSFTRLANDVIATCAFGVEVNSLQDPKNELYLIGKEATNFARVTNTLKFFLMFGSSFFRSFLKMPIFSKSVQTFFIDLITNTLRYREQNNVVRPDMIHLLMEARKGLLKEDNGSKELTKTSGTFAMLENSSYDHIHNEKQRLTELTDLDITAQAVLFLTGGFEAISSVLSFTISELAIHNDIQERLRDEIKESLTENNGQLTYQSILKMKYLDMVLSESLRKWSPGMLLDRICVKTYKIPKNPKYPNETDITLNPGDIILLNAIGIHRDPEIYPDPERFDPERFNDENRHRITPYNYIPFGVGPRHCIAIRFALMEIKTILAHLLLNFEYFPTEKTEMPFKSAEAMTSSAKNGFWVGLKKIS